MPFGELDRPISDLRDFEATLFADELRLAGRRREGAVQVLLHRLLFEHILMLVRLLDDVCP